MSRIISVLIEKQLVQRTGSLLRGGVLHLTEAGAGGAGKRALILPIIKISGWWTGCQLGI